MQQKPDLFDFIIERPCLSIITGLLLILLGILVSALPKMAASLRWETTSGIITSHKVQVKRFREYDGDVYEEIHISIRYEYIVDKTTYTSQSINAINMPFYPPEIAERYPDDKEVIVYYNPKNPAKALLEPGFVDAYKAFNVFSYLFFGAGIYFINRGISKIKNSHRNRRKIEIVSK
jgi:hypothetical protein